MRVARILALAAVLCACGDDGGGSETDAAAGQIDASPADAAPGSDPGEIVCGEDICESPDICCGDLNAAECTTAGLCDADFILECDDPGDCIGAGQVCCLTQDGASCTLAADCSGGQLCRDDDDCPDGTCSQLGFCAPMLR